MLPKLRILQILLEPLLFDTARQVMRVEWIRQALIRLFHRRRPPPLIIASAKIPTPATRATIHSEKQVLDPSDISMQ